MLPFYLRDSRHAASKKGTKRPRCDEIPPGDCGGPIQSAIINDLICLRKRFRQALVDYTKDHPDSLSLWKPGAVFSVFKEVFRSSKIGMLHLLPPARCDREAYSQLIYGACLSLFKESFWKIQRKTARQMEDSNDSIDHYNDSCFAIFLLLALFETNPLPRDIDTENPLELLPIGLKSLDDPRTSNRRCFSKNIRIDRQHFCLMLRLKELALARKADGEGLFFKFQRHLLKESALGQNPSGNKTEPGFLGNCSYGISTDIIEVLERIVPSFELCEYTGPVGAEAFAGHAEYPHNLSINRQSDSKETTTTATENELYHIDSSGGMSHEITALLQKYKASVTAIRIPQPKSNRVKRLQNNLRPLFSQHENMGAYDSIMIDIDSTFQTESDPNDVEIQEDHGDSGLGGFDDTQNESESLGRSNALSQYKLVLDRRINAKLKNALHASVTTLLTRNQLLFPISDIANGIPKSSLDADDVSSIGHGGISMATRNKNIALRNSRFAKERSTTKATTKQSLANEFLTFKQTADASSDEESVDSEITVSSFSEEDEISVATSAFGKRALKDLLQNVADDDIDVDGKKRNRKKRNPGRKNSKKRQIKEDSPDKELEEEDGVMSTATSAFGKRALDDLLKNAVEKDDTDKKKTSKPRKAKPQTKRKSSTKESSFESKRKSVNDEISVATSAFGKRALDDLLEHADSDGGEEASVATSAFGKRALGALLKSADSRTKRPASTASTAKTAKKATKKQKTGKASTKEPESTPKGGDDEISAATSAFGKRALDDLLRNADSHTNKPAPKKKATKKQKTGKASTKEPGSTPKGGDDEISVATSAFGKQALDDLLEDIAED